MNPWWIVAWAGAYLVGSIPVGFLMARARGIDIRAHGSGNVGATNVGRVLGRRAGLTCFAVDVLKGLVPTLAAGLAMGTIGAGPLPPERSLAWMGVAAGAIAGHMFPPWLGFRGGKGVATGFGALLGIYPVLTIAAGGALAVWIACAAVTRIVGVSSCVAAAVLPPLAFVAAGGSLRTAWPYLAVTTTLALVVIYRHRGNIRRTIDGTEHRIGQRVPAAGATASP